MKRESILCPSIKIRIVICLSPMFPSTNSMFVGGLSSMSLIPTIGYSFGVCVRNKKIIIQIYGNVLHIVRKSQLNFTSGYVKVKLFKLSPVFTVLIRPNSIALTSPQTLTSVFPLIKLIHKQHTIAIPNFILII